MFCTANTEAGDQCGDVNAQVIEDEEQGDRPYNDSGHKADDMHVHHAVFGSIGHVRSGLVGKPAGCSFAEPQAALEQEDNGGQVCIDCIDFVGKIEEIDTAEQGKNDKRNRAGGGNGFGKNIVPVSRGLPGLF